MSKSLKVIHISDLNGAQFNIPGYQRGYRWETKHVHALLKDILEEASVGNCTVSSNDINELQHHIKLLHDSGYLNLGNQIKSDSTAQQIIANLNKCSLTMKGYDLLDCMYYKGFEKVIEGLNNLNINGPLDLVVELTQKLIKKDMMNYLCLDES